MAIKKSGLYSSIWPPVTSSAGAWMPANTRTMSFMLFIKYITEKYGNSDMMSPRRSFRRAPASTTWDNERLARSDFPDFNDPNKLGEGPAMVERLSNLIGIFQKPELTSRRTALNT